MAGPRVQVTSDGSALGTLQEQFRGFSRELTRGFSIFTGGALARGVRDAVASLPQAIGTLRQEFDRIGKLATGLRETPENIQRMGMAASLSGAQVETLSRSMGRLDTSLEDLDGSTRRQTAIRTLGLDAEALSSANLEQRLAMIADAYSQMEDRTAASAAVTTLMGNSARELLPLLEQGGDRIRGLADGMDVLEARDVRAIEAFNDQLTLFGRNIQVAIAKAFTGEMQNLSGVITSLINGMQNLARFIAANMAVIRSITVVIASLGTAMIAGKVAAMGKAMALQLLGRSATGAAAGMATLGRSIKAFATAAALGIGAALVAFQAFTARLEEAVRLTEDAQERGNQIARDFHRPTVQGRIGGEAERARELERIDELREEELRKLNQLRNMSGFGRSDAMQEAARAHEHNLQLLDLARGTVAGITEETMAATRATRATEAAAQAQADAIAEAAENVEQMREAYEKVLAKIEDQRAKDLPLNEQVERLESKLHDALDVARAMAQEMGGAAGLDTRGLERMAREMAEGTEDQRAAAAQLFEILGEVAQLEEQIRQTKDQSRDAAEKLAEQETAAAQKKAQALADYEHELALLDAEIVANDEKIQQLEAEARIRQDIARLVESGLDAETAGRMASSQESRRQQRDQAEADRATSQQQQELDRLLGDLRLRERTGDSPAARVATRARDRADELMNQFGDTGLTDERAREIALREQALENGLGGAGGGRSQFGAISSMAAIGGGGGIEVATRDLAAEQLSELRQVREILTRISDNDAVL